MTDEDRYTRITLRIPRDLHDLLVREAFTTAKSLNAEIIGRLMSSFGAGATASEDANLLRDEADELSRRLFSIDARLDLIRTQLESVKTRHSMASMRRAMLDSSPLPDPKEHQKLGAEFEALWHAEVEARRQLADAQSMRSAIVERQQAVGEELRKLARAGNA